MLGGEVDIARRTPGGGDELRLVLQVRLGKADPLVGSGQHDLGFGLPDRLDERALVVGGRGARRQDVDADHLGSRRVDRFHQPCEQRAVDGLANLALLECVVADADDGHMRVLARQPVGEKGRPHVSQHVLEAQQAGRIARRKLGEK